MDVSVLLFHVAGKKRSPAILSDILFYGGDDEEVMAVRESLRM
jgi:hypothetical protein